MTQSLEDYVKNQLRAGYSEEQIKDYLKKYGYKEAQIDQAMGTTQINVKHTIHPSKTTIALVIAVICTLIIISAAIFYYLGPGKQPSQLLDIKTTLLSANVYENDNLRFTVELSNLGSKKRYDVELKHEIFNLNDQRQTFKEHTMAVETKASAQIDIPLTGLTQGNYYLKSTAIYNDKTAKATSSFTILKKTAPIEPKTECPASCDDNNLCTDDFCSQDTNYECRHDTITPCCGNGICESGEDETNCIADCQQIEEDDDYDGQSIWQKIESISELAQTDKTSAVSQCNTIEHMTYKYECFAAVAIKINDEDICLNIEDEPTRDVCYKDVATTNREKDVCKNILKDSKRDQCYMDFVSKGDYSVCNELINKYLKQSCESLKNLAENP